MATPATMLSLFVILSTAHHVAPAHHPYVRPHHLHRLPARPHMVVPDGAVAKAPKAQAPVNTDDVEAVESVETVETVEPVDAALPTSTPGTPGAVLNVDPNAPAVPPYIEHVLGVAPNAEAPLTSAAGVAAVLGHLHAAVVHLPIAWTMLWAVLEMASLVGTSAAWGQGALFLAFISLVSFGPAVLTGLCRFDELASTSKGYETGEALLHRNLIFVAAVLCAVTLVIRLINARWPNSFFRVLCLLGAMSAFVVTGLSAHLGGRMVYGADFLPF